MRKTIISSILMAVIVLFSMAQAAPLKVALVIPGTFGDKSFFDSAMKGSKDAKKKFGDKISIKTIELTYDATKWASGYADVANGNYDLVITIGFELGEFIPEFVKKYPNKYWAAIDQEYNDKYSNKYPNNLVTFTFAENEASYLVGYLAVKLSEEKAKAEKSPKALIGFLGGMDIPVVNNFLVGYIEGAKKANSNAKVMVSYIGNFTDAPKGKEMTLAQYAQGVNIGYGVAGNAGMGQFDAAVEKGKLAIGVDSDQAMLLEEVGQTKKAAVIPTSLVKRIDLAVIDSIDAALNKTPMLAKNNVLGLNSGGVGIAKNKYYKKLVSAKIQSEIDALEKDLKSGKIKVPTSHGISQEKMQALRNSVKP